MSAQLATSAHPSAPPVAQRGHAWEPVSVCTPGCLPAPETLPRVGRLRVAQRLVALATVLAGAAVLACVLLPLLGRRRRTEVMRRLFRALLRAAGVRVAHIGPAELGPAEPGAAESGAADRPAPGTGRGVLVVANHLSWLDILALGAVQPMRMVAKREIQGWPVIGSLAERIGTLFVDRTGLRSLPAVVEQAAEAMRSGATVGLFPEGTTWCGSASGAFRRAGFQAALDAGVPVRPVAQRMLLSDGTPTTVGSFIGEDTLLDSMLRVLRLPGLVIEVRVLPLLTAGPGTDRRQLARRAELAVAAATGVPAPVAATRPVPVAMARVAA